MKIFTPISMFVLLFTVPAFCDEPAADAFDNDDPSAVFTANQPIKPGKYTGSEAEQIGRQVLKKANEVNRYWFSAPKSEVRRWTYTFRAQLSDGQKMEKQMKLDRDDSSAPNDWPSIRGNTYIGAGPSVCGSSPQFKTVEVTKDQIKLHFLLSGDDTAFQMIGNGLGGQWFGSFRAGEAEGMLYVDAKDFTLIGIKLPSGGFEKYTDYVDLDTTCKVPRRIEIEHVGRDRMYFDMRFKAYEPGLWLFDRSEYMLNKKKTSTASLSDLSINGAAPVEISPSKKR